MFNENCYGEKSRIKEGQEVKGVGQAGETNTVIQVGLIEKMAFNRRLKGSEGVSQASI